MMKKTYILGAIILGILIVTGLIIGLLASGVIGVSAPRLTVTSDSAEMVYSGEPLVCDVWHRCRNSGAS